MSASAVLDAWNANLDRVGSTRAVGLMRLFTGLLLWSRWAREMMPMREPDQPDRLALSIAFFVLTTLMVVGYRTRFAVPATAALLWVMVAGYGEGQVPDWGHHHTNLHMLAVTWLAFTPSGRSFSIDRLLAIRRAEAEGRPWPEERGPLWAVPLLSLQVCTLYLWSLVDKLQNGLYTGVQLEQLSMYYVFGASPPGIPTVVYQLLAVTVLLAELLLPIGLFTKRWRPLAAVLGVVMHALFYVLIPVNTFTMQMIVLYLAFFPADQVHRVIDRLLGYRSTRSTRSTEGPASATEEG